MIEAKAGAGAMGIVYRATDLETNKRVALKTMRAADRESVSRFAREAEVLAALRHPSIVEYVAHGEAKDEAFLVMEWLEGASLKALLEERKLSTVEVLELGEAIASALVVAHANGVVHRDLKPANVFLSGRSTAETKVVDFGIASLCGSKMLTATGAVLGTPSYMAPEQVLSARRADGRSDLFSLGTVLFRCFAGRAPFQGDDTMETMLALTSTRAPFIRSVVPTVPSKLAAAIDAVLEREPNDRPADATAVLRMLGEARREIAPKTYQARTSERIYTVMMGPPIAMPTVAIGPGFVPPSPLLPAPTPRTVLAPPPAPTAIMPAGAPPASSFVAAAAPAARPRSSAFALGLVAGGVLLLGGAALAVYFATAKPTKPAKLSESRDDTSVSRSTAAPKPSAAASALPQAHSALPVAPSAAPFDPTCPPMATCFPLDVPDVHHASESDLEASAFAYMKANHPGDLPQLVSVTGLTDGGIDLTVSFNGLTVQFQHYTAMVQGRHFVILDQTNTSNDIVPKCDVAASYKAARAQGLPSGSANAYDSIDTVTFTADGRTIVLDDKTCVHRP